MKIFGCSIKHIHYGGGLILVAADSVEEAFYTAAVDRRVGYMFDWTDNSGEWVAPGSDGAKCCSDYYPFEDWVEYKKLSCNCTEPYVIAEEHHCEW